MVTEHNQVLLMMILPSYQNSGSTTMERSNVYYLCKNGKMKNVVTYKMFCLKKVKFDFSRNARK